MDHQKALENINEIIQDKSRIWGQFLQKISEKVGYPAEQVALGAACCLGAYLTCGNEPRLLANLLLIGFPLFIQLFAPQELPAKKELMTVYWCVFGATTLMDTSLHKSVPAYYALKVVLHAALFLRPYCLAERISEMAERGGGKTKTDDDASHKEVPHRLFSKEELTSLLDRKKKSPPPEKPCDEKEKESRHGDAAPSDPSQPVLSVRIIPKAPAPIPDAQTAVSPSVPPMVSDRPGNDFKPSSETNPMLAGGSPYTTSADTPVTPRPDSMVSGVSPNGPAVGQFDLEFEPKRNLVFNGPFDYTDKTYHMKLKNVSRFPVAYAIKSNAIPRLAANPPFGIIKAGKNEIIAVTLQKFDSNAVNVEKDRIAFDYVRVGEDVKEFQFKLLQFSNAKRRKNIYIKYNP